MIFHLTLDGDIMYLQWKDKNSWTKKRVRSVDEICQFIAEELDNRNLATEDYMVMCSSTLDWPEDETSNRKTIELCNQIRGNNV